TRSSVGTAFLSSGVWARTACHTVGTPIDSVTPSSASIGTSSGGWTCIPAKTSLAPAIAAAYGTPQALTWNMGTTGQMRSVARAPMSDADVNDIACSTVDRLWNSAPLGLPVVPDV